MSRIVQVFVFLLLLGRVAVQDVRLYVAPHAPGACSLEGDAGELADTNQQPLHPALLAGAPAVPTVSQPDSAALLPRITAPQTTGAASAAIDESCLPSRSVRGAILGRAPPLFLS